MKVTWDYFCGELSTFRKIIGLKTYTLEEWEGLWIGLLWVYILLEERTEDAADAIKTIEIDYHRRVRYRLGLR
ncbi:hypothetical protein LCGC14_2145080 [marine sediment metagenome]|uniref:Uncharacterized protein n=1 Tax=marine sediment metagenome TaxID=412755 RepID=A0A0F9EJI3_9ZZZZ